MGTHRIYIGSQLQAGELEIAGDEAHHAIRVKRLKAGDPLEVLDGRGRIGAAVILGAGKDRAGFRLSVRVEEVRQVPELRPRIEVYAPVPKGPRLSEMIDGLSQVGAASWTPLASALSVGEARPTRMQRMERVAAEASKQCGRPWLLEVGAAMAVTDALALGGDAATVVADVSGGRYRATGAPIVRVLVGPEGGWRSDELAMAAEQGVPIARFGPYAMRIETAAVTAAAVVLDHEAHQR